MRRLALAALAGVAALAVATLDALAPARASADGLTGRLFGIETPFRAWSARAAGMGAIGSTLDDGAVALFLNPGMLANDLGPGLAISRSQIVPRSDEFFVWSASLHAPLPFGPRGSVIGIGYERQASPSWRQMVPLQSGDLITVEHDPRERAIVGAVALPVVRGVGVGLGVENVSIFERAPVPDAYWEQDRLGEEGDAWAVNMGIGARREFVFSEEGEDSNTGGRVTVAPLAGVALLHAGEALDLNETASVDLYRVLRTGFGLRVRAEPAPDHPHALRRTLRRFEVLSVLEATFPARHWDDSALRQRIPHYGAEVMLSGLLSMRLGYTDTERYGSDESFGLGLRAPGSWPLDARVDWASVPYGREHADQWMLAVGRPANR